MSQERVQKILAKAGIASRRKAEELILEGQVTINGKLATLGDKAELGKDAIKVKGKLLQGAEEKVYIAFHKPKAVISMLADPEGRPTLADYLTKVQSRVFPIGRLDFTSEGLILLTNDGDVAEKLQRRDDIPRVYRVKVKGHASPEMLERLKRGMKTGNRHVAPHSVRLAEIYQNKSSIEIVMMGAGAVDVKAMVEQKGFLVERMVRTSFGHITLHGLPAGHYRFLKFSQIQAILEQPELAMRQIEQDAEKEAVEVRPLHGRRGLRDERREDEAEGTGELPAPRTERQERAPRFGGGRGAKPGYGDKPSFGRSERREPREGGWQRDRAPRRDDRGDFGDRKPRFGDRKPRFDGDKPGFGDRKPRFGDRKPRGEGFGGDKPRFGDRKPRGAGFGGDKPRFGDRKPRGAGFGGDKPRFGDRKPRFDGDKPSFGDRKPRGAGFGDKPSYGDRKPRGAGFGDKPRFGDRKPRGAGFGGKPSFGDRKPRGAGFGGKPSFGDRKPRGAGFGGKPSFGDRKPRGAGFGGKPSFGDKPRGKSSFAGKERAAGGTRRPIRIVRKAPGSES